jgi:hypothetical protein
MEKDFFLSHLETFDVSCFRTEFTDGTTSSGKKDAIYLTKMAKSFQMERP